MNLSIPVKDIEILLGIENDSHDKMISQLNYTILQGKYFIHRCHQEEKDINLLSCLQLLKNSIGLKYQLYQVQNKSKRFENQCKDLIAFSNVR